MFDITPEGVKKTSSARLLTQAQNTLLFSMMMLATAGLAYVFYGYYSNVFTTAPPAIESVAALNDREFVAPENSIAVLPFADLSESALRQAIKLNDDYIPAYLWFSGMLGEQGRLPEQSLVALKPDSTTLLRIMSNHAMKSGDLVDAWEGLGSDRASIARRFGPKLGW